MRNSKSLIVYLICTSLLLAAPLQAAKKKPNPNAPIKVISVVGNTKKATPKSYVKRKQVVSSMKATLKRGKKTLEKARVDLSAVRKSEMRNRKDRLKATAKKDKAFLAMQANNNGKTQAAYAKALKAYSPVKERHESSLKVLNSQRARVSKLENFKTQAMNAKRAATRMQPRQGAPAAINRSPQFVRPISAFHRVHPELLPSPPTHQPGQQRQNNSYQGQLSPLGQYLNNNHYQIISGNTSQQQNAGNNQSRNYVNMPGAPAFNY